MRTRVPGPCEPFTFLEIEEYLCDLSSPEAAARIEETLRDSPDLVAYVDERRAEKAAFHLHHPPARPAFSTQPRTPWLSWRIPALAAGVVALALLVVFIKPGQELDRDLRRAEEIRSMGGIKTHLAIERDGRRFEHREDILLRPGDRVRLSVEAPAAGYLTVLAREQGGKIHVYYDRLATHAGTFTVPDSLVLDEQEAREVWFVVLTAEVIASDLLVDRLRAGADLGVPVSVIEIEKERVP